MVCYFVVYGILLPHILLWTVGTVAAAPPTGGH